MSKVKARAVKIEKIANGVLLCRGISKFKIIGEDLFEIIQKIFSTLSEPMEYQRVILLFHEIQQEPIQKLLTSLIEHDFISVVGNDDAQNSSRESSEDIFYWHFGRLVRKQVEKIKTTRILIISNDAISSYLNQAMHLSGFRHIENVNNDPEINIINYDCVLYGSDVNDVKSAVYWNQMCLEKNINFMPVILDNIYSYIGPLVVPNNTACYECFVKRKNANLLPDLLDYTDLATHLIQGYHPVMPMITAGLAALELTKFYTEIRPSNIGKMISIDFIKNKTRHHTVLRLPNCRLCCKP